MRVGSRVWVRVRVRVWVWVRVKVRVRVSGTLITTLSRPVPFALPRSVPFPLIPHSLRLRIRSLTLPLIKVATSHSLRRLLVA